MVKIGTGKWTNIYNLLGTFLIIYYKININNNYMNM